MRTSLPKKRQTGSTAGLKAQNQPQKARLAAAEAVRQPSRRSRSRLSDGPQLGVFGADMRVALVNDGPVTIWLET